MIPKVFMLLVGMLLIAGCASPGGAPIDAGRTPSAPTATSAPTAPVPTAASLPEATQTPALDLPSLETPLANPAVEALVQQAREMLANKLGIDPGAIRLFDLKAMDWRDESLGCPLGGRNYAQVITPGYLIELEVDSAIYIFHSDQATRVVLCGLEPTREIYQPP
jgi:hypothetical protein